MTALILAAMLALPVAAFDRHDSAADRLALYTPIAEAIAEVARTRHEAALLVAYSYAETKWDSRVVLGLCVLMPRGSCDSLRARGVFSLHREACRSAYEYDEGTPQSLRLEARCALRLMRGYAYVGREHALTPTHAAFCGMAARPFSWSGAEPRVALVRRVERGMR